MQYLAGCKEIVLEQRIDVLLDAGLGFWLLGAANIISMQHMCLRFLSYHPGFQLYQTDGTFFSLFPWKFRLETILSVEVTKVPHHFILLTVDIMSSSLEGSCCDLLYKRLLQSNSILPNTLSRQWLLKTMTSQDNRL